MDDPESAVFKRVFLTLGQDAFGHDFGLDASYDWRPDSLVMVCFEKRGTRKN
jgi:hypothetical protein